MPLLQFTYDQAQARGCHVAPCTPHDNHMSQGRVVRELEQPQGRAATLGDVPLFAGISIRVR
ncbi:hypothetical protein KDA_11140 [Dictyobacter alpinus]|uniref:Uncharacterized protein n=1 Tax=Dictyobacter alpinus TaxID=2014873 RepID=A0A402B2P2_9CHLR|nr:hypothetical protein KDA_11140 [Dictyobacter alpinus]